MTALTYAGIGVRATLSSVLADMTVIARWLARTRAPATGWHLHSSGALARLQRPPGSGLRGALRARAPSMQTNPEATKSGAAR